MGNILRPTNNTQQPIGKKRTKIQRRWIAMLGKYDKFTAMKASFDDLPPETLTEEMVALKTAIDQHFAAPELTKAFEHVYAVHPDWERPKWFMEKKGTTVRKGERSVREIGEDHKRVGTKE